MKLMHQRFPKGNFGDDLNPWLWPRLLPGAFDDRDDVLFSSVGSWLHPGKIMTRDCRYVIFGTGAGYTSLRFSLGRKFPWAMEDIETYLASNPLLPDGWERRNTRIYCVRGPLTARALKLDASLAAADPGILVQRFARRGVTRTGAVSYMPHHRTAQLTDIEGLCRDAGLDFIDPRADVDAVLTRISASRALVTEALHGAIASDALRVPWVPVASAPWILPFKWRDYCESMDLPYRPIPLAPVWRASSIIESAAVRQPRPSPLLVRLRVWWANPRNRDSVCASLVRAAAVAPVLSSDDNMQRGLARLDEALDRLKRDVQSGELAAWEER